MSQKKPLVCTKKSGMPKGDRVASLRVKSPGKMTARQRADVVKWLRKTADFIAKEKMLTNGRFTAGLLYIR